MTDADLLAKGLGKEAVALLLQILRGKGPADVHVLLGPLRGKARSVEVVMTRKLTASGEGDSIAVDSTTARA